MLNDDRWEMMMKEEMIFGVGGVLDLDIYLYVVCCVICLLLICGFGEFVIMVSNKVNRCFLSNWVLILCFYLDIVLG